MNTVVLRNAEVINEGRRFHADVLIRDGRIERIGAIPAGFAFVLAGSIAFPFAGTVVSGEGGTRFQSSVSG